MSEPVDTSAEAVERASVEEEARIESALRYDDSEYQLAFQEGYWRAMTIAERRWTKERAEQETLLAGRNRQNAAAFTASDAYQKRCEQGDALLRNVIDRYNDPHASFTSDLADRIDAHLAGEDMGGAKEGK